MSLSALEKTAKPRESVEESIEVEYALIPIGLKFNIFLEWWNKPGNLVLFKSFIACAVRNLFIIFFKLYNINRSLLYPFFKEV